MQAERKRIQLRPLSPDLDNANVGNLFDINLRGVPIRHFPFNFEKIYLAPLKLEIIF